jgi:hypothetical protein
MRPEEEDRPNYWGLGNFNLGEVGIGKMGGD